MGRKQNRRKQIPVRPFAVGHSGPPIEFTRVGVLMRLLDTAIWLWFFEKEPLAVHLLGSAALRCLSDIGKKADKTPALSKTIAPKELSRVYDFLRHASSNVHEKVPFYPSDNNWILFDAVNAFENNFGGRSVYMSTFACYLALNVEPFKARFSGIDLLLFLPQGGNVEQLRQLGRVEFLEKVLPLFGGDSFSEPVF